MTRALSLLGIVSLLTSSSYAQELPAVPDSAIQATLNRLTLEEGTEIKLAPETVSELTPWMKNSKLALEDLLEQTSTMRPTLAKETLLHGIRTAVLESAPKRTELLMRYVLNRALKVIELMDQFSEASTPGVISQELRVLRQSIQFALKYYESDLNFLKEPEKAPPPLASFGVQYVQFLMTINESQLNARAQYAVAAFTLGLLHVDLARDVNAKAFAPVIGKIKTFLEIAPSTPPQQSSDALSHLRNIRSTLLNSFDYLNNNFSELTPQKPKKEKPPSFTPSTGPVLSQKEIQTAIKSAYLYESPIDTNKFLESFANNNILRIDLDGLKLIIGKIRNHPRNHANDDLQTPPRILAAYLVVHSDQMNAENFSEFLSLNKGPITRNSILIEYIARKSPTLGDYVKLTSLISTYSRYDPVDEIGTSKRLSDFYIKRMKQNTDPILLPDCLVVARQLGRNAPEAGNRVLYECTKALLNELTIETLEKRILPEITRHPRTVEWDESDTKQRIVDLWNRHKFK